MANTKKWFDTKKEALTVRDERRKRFPDIGLFKKKEGRNKGRFFVGSEIEFINLVN